MTGAGERRTLCPEPLDFASESRRSLYRALAITPIFLGIVTIAVGWDWILVGVSVWFLLVPLAIILEAGQTVWQRRRDMRWRWEFDEDGVHVFRKDEQKRQLPWELIRNVRVDPSSARTVNLYLKGKFFPVGIRGIPPGQSAALLAFWMRMRESSPLRAAV